MFVGYRVLRTSSSVSPSSIVHPSPGTSCVSHTLPGGGIPIVWRAGSCAAVTRRSTTSLAGGVATIRSDGGFPVIVTSGLHCKGL